MYFQITTTERKSREMQKESWASHYWSRYFTKRNTPSKIDPNWGRASSPWIKSNRSFAGLIALHLLQSCRHALGHLSPLIDKWQCFGWSICIWPTANAMRFHQYVSVVSSALGHPWTFVAVQLDDKDSPRSAVRSFLDSKMVNKWHCRWY